MKRTAEFVLGLIGGIIGIFSSLIALFVGGVGTVFEAEGASTVTGLGWAAALFSILAIVGAAIVKGKPKVAGVMLLVAGIGGFISISMFYIIPGILILIAGIMALVRKPSATND
ncbi:DUF4064 domain-containing protein [Mahella sp.]|uniref:DUF4064 domain-containing protein n=1 Tax=Mahella sp. TaxID=2798721 RepID=UPI0025BD120C|nr:DUF4064 domain-containing protein [Mahella sp.]MBZ4666574.1 hypothetical protein [Mahella sp.]